MDGARAMVWSQSRHWRPSPVRPVSRGDHLAWPSRAAARLPSSPTGRGSECAASIWRVASARFWRAQALTSLKTRIRPRAVACRRPFTIQPPWLWRQTFALIADVDSNRVRRVQLSTGFVATLAGKDSAAHADGTGTLASFNRPAGVAIVVSGPFGGYAIVADTGNKCMRSIVIATGAVVTVAGDPTRLGNADGVGPLASFKTPVAVAASEDGAFVIVTDFEAHTVRRMDLATRDVTTLAGTGAAGSADGTGTLASFNQPFGVAISADGAFAVIAEVLNYRVRRIALATRLVSTLVGSVQGYVNGPAGALALFAEPRGIALSYDAKFALVADAGSQTLRRIDLTAPCAAGHYCAAGSSSPTQALCTATGSFCPAGSSSALPGVCAAGAYCPTPASQIPCSAGYYCAAGSTADRATQCLLGTFCAAGSSANSVNCAAGSFCTTPSSQV